MQSKRVRQRNISARIPFIKVSRKFKLIDSDSKQIGTGLAKGEIQAGGNTKEQEGTFGIIGTFTVLIG